MNGRGRLLIVLFTMAAMPSFADTKIATAASGENRLEALFKADLQYKSGSESDGEAQEIHQRLGVRAILGIAALPDYLVH